MIIFFVFGTTPTPILNSLQNLVISWPKSQSWIISGSSDLLFDLFFNIDQKIFSGRVDAVTKHEIIEKHDTFSWS